MRKPSTIAKATAAIMRIRVVVSISSFSFLSSLRPRPLLTQIFFKAFEHDDHGRTDRHDEERREYEEDKREDQLHSSLSRRFLRILAAACPKRLGIRPQRLANA